MTSRNHHPVIRAVTWATLAFLTLPTVIVIAASFTGGEVVTFPPEGVSLRWYGELMDQTRYWDGFLRSLYVSLICTLLAIPAGTLAALAMARYRVRAVSGLQIYFLLPFTVPLIVSGLGMMMVFGEAGILGRLWPVGVGLCVINIPFMIWAVAASVNGLDPDLENAAANCGAPPVHVFLTITLPAVMPGVVTGALIMFILAMNEFVVSLILVNARIVTLPVLIYNGIRSVLTPDIAAVSVIYIAIAVAAVWLLDRLVGLEIFLRSK